MVKLTASQWKCLRAIERSGRHATVKFQTADSLRKLGLLERETIHVVKRIYADERGVFPQFERPADRAVIWHDFALTDAGREVLKAEDGR